MEMWPTLLLLLLLLAPAISTTASAARCHPDDEAGLLAFKSAVTADPTGLLSSWKPGTDCCTWDGISCRMAFRVTEVTISGSPGDPASYLSGTIPPSFARLRRLIGIYFDDLKNLTGDFPAALLHLPDLQYIFIRNASLSGTIPDLAPLAQLSQLNLRGNRFSGPIPDSVGRLTQLTQLDLSRNRLSGGIPPSVGRLSNLTLLSLEHNELSGALPDMSRLTGLSSLELSHNHFAGEIPPSLAPLAPRLRVLKLGHNRLTGRIPAFLVRFTELDTLDLSDNALVDPFPELAVRGIESLDLSRNRFHLGKIPRWVATSAFIYSLKLAGCGIKMKMEDFKPAETYFYDYIDLSDNEITGSPVALLNRTQRLVSFRAAGNKLSFDMARLPLPQTLQDLDLSRNMVYGKVPAAASGLKTLNVSYNRLCGPLPKTALPASAFAGNACLCGTPLAPCQRRS